jgi:hypothetical protein
MTAVRRLAGSMLILGAVLFAQASAAQADVTYATVAHPTPVSFFAGRLAWSAFEPARNGYVLMTHQGGVTSTVPVQPRGVPFDADLGPDGHGDTVAVYSRCGREPSFSPEGNAPPEWSSGRGCNVFQFNFATGRETRVASANTDGNSEFLPSIWETTIAFARVYERRPGRAGDRAYLYARTLLGTPSSTRLPAGPRAVPVETGPAALDLRGRRLAFAWATRGDCPGAVTGIWLDTVGGGQQRIQSACHSSHQGRAVVSPTISGGRVYYSRSNTIGEELGSRIRYYRIKTRTRREVLALPRAAALATATDAGRTFYLAAVAFPARCTGGVPGVPPLPGEPPTPPCQLNEFTP